MQVGIGPGEGRVCAQGHPQQRHQPPFDKPKNGRIAIKVINHLGDEVMKVFRV